MAAPDHPRLVILKRFTAIFQTIKTVNGYSHDLSLPGRVVRGRAELGDNDAENMPLVSILEAPRPDAGAIFTSDGDSRHEQWNLLVQGWTQDDVKNPSDPLYALLADVEACLALEVLKDGSENYMLRDEDRKPLITGLQILPPVVRPPSSTPAAKACFLLPLRVGLALGVG